MSKEERTGKTDDEIVPSIRSQSLKQYNLITNFYLFPSHSTCSTVLITQVNDKSEKVVDDFYPHPFDKTIESETDKLLSLVRLLQSLGAR